MHGGQRKGEKRLRTVLCPRYNRRQIAKEVFRLKQFKGLCGAAALLLAVGMTLLPARAEEATPETAATPESAAVAEDYTGWVTEGLHRYWYENGVRQGTEGRGKEIYDPETDGWYWLDAAQGGAMAVDQDVYQESDAGPYADREDGTGKWCRYGLDGKMVKGWSTNPNGTSYFDEVYGAMIKGWQTVDGELYHFGSENGLMDRGIVLVDGQVCGFHTDGTAFDMIWRAGEYEGSYGVFWYEKGVRQGCDLYNPAYRGKEIYDPASDAWYWLDNNRGGARAAGKEVYIESADGTGKWVRYDAQGKMIKGWYLSGLRLYYYDPITGAMAKGWQKIGFRNFYFDPITGICQNLFG